MGLVVRCTYTRCSSNCEQILVFLDHSEAQYKIVRAVDPVLDLFEVVARSKGCSDQFLEGVKYSRMSAKVVRDILGVIYILTSLLPNFLTGCKVFYDQHVSPLCRKNPPDEHPPVYQQRSKKYVEHGLHFGALASKFVKAASQLLAFFSKPFVQTETLQTLILAKHAAGFSSVAFEMSYRYVSIRRTLDAGLLTESEYEKYQNKIMELSVGLLEKGLQVVYDCIKMLEKNPAPKIRLPFTFLIAGLGLYKVSLKMRTI